jgi:hypothetical protein
VNSNGRKCFVRQKCKYCNNILFTAIGLSPGGSGHLTHIQNMRLTGYNKCFKHVALQDATEHAVNKIKK